MSVIPLHHAVLTVSDFDRSLAFYTEVLGLRKTLESPVAGYERYLHLPEGTTGRMAMLAADERTLGMVEIIQWDIPGGATATAPKRPGDPGVAMLAFELAGETLEDVVVRLNSAGVELFSPITPVDLEGYPRFQTLLVEDPDGLLIELIQLPTREEVRAFRAAQRAQQATAGVGDSR
jgi:catechol 2,3-dioxygenase-like lactoylglutathione lyase family enzyme